jgi:hypothetical protein
VRFQVYLDEYGNLFGINRLAFSGDPAFSAAVEQAIRAAGPFPEHMVKTFQFDYSIDVGAGGRLLRDQAPGRPKARQQARQH